MRANDGFSALSRRRISSMLSVEVLEARSAPGLHSWSSSAKISFFKAMFSNAASITMSASANPSSAQRRGNQRHPLIHHFLREATFLHRVCIVSGNRRQPSIQCFLCRFSSSALGMPALAKFIAMPPPIVPAPTTAALAIGSSGVSFGMSESRRLRVRQEGVDHRFGLIGEEAIPERVRVRACSRQRVQFGCRFDRINRGQGEPSSRARLFRLRSGCGKDRGVCRLIAELLISVACLHDGLRNDWSTSKCLRAFQQIAFDDLVNDASG